MKREHLIAAREAAAAYPPGFGVKWSAAPDGSEGFGREVPAESAVASGEHVP